VSRPPQAWPGLSGVDFPLLERILLGLEAGRLRPPYSEAQLRAFGVAEELEVLRAALAPFDAASARAALRLVLAERSARPRSQIELVWTGPEPNAAESRKTTVVVRRLFEAAQQHVLIAGYAFDHGEEILRPLYKAMVERNVRAQIFLDIPGEAASDDAIETFASAAIERFFLDNWPFGPARPTIYYDARTVSPTYRASLHAKCVVVDEARTLVTSANFTSRGHARNIEVGVLIDDDGFARRLVGHWNGLVASGAVRRFSR